MPRVGMSNARYLGLRAGQSMRVVVDDRSLLVKPDVAAAQFDAERQPEPLPTNGPEPEPGGGSGSLVLSRHSLLPLRMLEVQCR